MDRRACIKTVLWSAGVMFGAPLFARGGDDADAQSAGSGKKARSRLGLQLFTLRNLLRQDPRKVLESAAAIGFSEFELFGFGSSVFFNDPLFGMTARELKALLRNLGVSIPMVHFAGSGEKLPQIAATALELGAHHLVLGMPAEFIKRTAERPVVSGVTSLEQIKRLASHLNDLGSVCKRSGIGFAYHNHHMEFAALGNELAYDRLLADTDPALVKMELDVGWARVAGVDAVSYLERFPDRFVACHLKDFNPQLSKALPSAVSPIPEMTQLVAPGEGIIDFGRLLAAMDRVGVRHGFVEVDLAQGDPLDVCRRGFRYLSNLGK